jgi:predicted dehydrogenase
MIRIITLLVSAAVFPLAAADAPPLRLAIAGLVHGHVDGFFRAAKNRPDVQIVGIYDPDAALHHKYRQKYGFAESLFYTDLATMLDKLKPQAVASFTNTLDHPVIVEACGPRHIPVMMEKPLAVSVADAKRIARAAERGGIPVIVNYETTWYASHGAAWKVIKEDRAAGEIRKMVAMDGHQGPQEIGVPPEFFGWLTDQV